jgi:MFS family permease
MGGEWALGVALVMECWPATLRPLLAGFIGAASNVGFLLIAMIGLKFQVTPDSWRWILLVGAAPALLTFFIQTLVPESTSWRHAVSQSSTNNPLNEVFGPHLRARTWIAIALAGTALVGTWGSVQWMPTWTGKELLRDASPEYQSDARAWVQIASAVGAIGGCFAGSLLGGKLGRRPVYFGLCLLSLAFSTTTFLLFKSYSNELLAMTFCVGFVTASFYGWLPLYLPELFPTRVRATGQGVAFNAGRLVAAVGALGMGALVTVSGSFASAGVYINLVYLVGAALIWFAPETHGKPLPD